MPKPLISIVIPAYNAEKYLGECLESILVQTYKNIEIIIVNDGSTDDTAKIIKLYKEKDPRIRSFTCKNNGVSSARNRGIKESCGEYIFFVDSDDFLDHDCIEYYYNLIETTNAEISIVPMPKKVLSSEKRVSTPEERKPEIITGKTALKRMLYYQIVISSWGKLFSKKLIAENNIRFNENLAYGEGFSFSLECYQAAKKVAVGYKKSYNYRLDNSESVMTKYKRRLVTDSLKAQRYIQSFIKFCSRDMIDALAYAKWHTNCDCLNTIVGSKTTQDQDLKKQLVKDIRKNSLVNLKKPISKKDKLKSILYFISPICASKIINSGRKRKFTKV